MVPVVLYCIKCSKCETYDLKKENRMYKCLSIVCVEEKLQGKFLLVIRRRWQKHHHKDVYTEVI